MPTVNNSRSTRSFGSRRKRDVASNHPPDSSFLIMNDDEGFSFPVSIWGPSATARVKAFFSPRPRSNRTSPLSSRSHSANTSPIYLNHLSPITPDPHSPESPRTPSKGFKATISKACKLFKPSRSYSPMKEGKRVQREITYNVPCPIVQAKEERRWRNLAEERQILVNEGKRQAERRKERERSRRTVLDVEWRSKEKVREAVEEPVTFSLQEILSYEPTIGHYHDGETLRQFRLSQIGLDDN